jgi:hypothetical protein
LSVAVDGVGSKDNGSVYVIDADPLQDLPGQPVHQLMHVHGVHSDEEDWAWHSLPPPPYAHAPGSCKDGGSRAEITCHAVAVPSKVDRHHALVWVSTAGRGTYWLDPARHVWTKAGDWVLARSTKTSPTRFLCVFFVFIIETYAFRMYYEIGAWPMG